MKEISLSTSITEYDKPEELSAQDQDLLDRAFKSASDAYAPYSGFQVGAAILLENGEIVTGNNQENAAYPSGLCAERVAIFYAGAKYPGVAVKTVAIRVISSNDPVNMPVAPCGSCRQSMAEYEVKSNQPIRILMMGESGSIFEAPSVESLLPLMFKGNPGRK